MKKKVVTRRQFVQKIDNSPQYPYMYHAPQYHVSVQGTHQNESIFLHKVISCDTAGICKGMTEHHAVSASDGLNMAIDAKISQID